MWYFSPRLEEARRENIRLREQVELMELEEENDRLRRRLADRDKTANPWPTTATRRNGG
jgi:hypothetical protein